MSKIECFFCYGTGKDGFWMITDPYFGAFITRGSEFKWVEMPCICGCKLKEDEK